MFSLSELGSCVKVEVAILGSLSLIVLMASVDAKQKWTWTWGGTYRFGEEYDNTVGVTTLDLQQRFCHVMEKGVWHVILFLLEAWKNRTAFLNKVLGKLDVFL